MNKIKIYHRSPVVWNVIIFILLGFLFLLLQEVFFKTASITNKEILLNFVAEKYILLSLLGITTFLLFRLNIAARYFYWLSVTAVSVYTVTNLADEFSKIIIILLFFYLLFAYYLFQFFSIDQAESFYNPKFNDHFLFSPMTKKVGLQMTFDDKRKVQGYLTNWSDAGFFIHASKTEVVRGNCDIKIEYEEHVFRTRAAVVAYLSNGTGVGCRIIEDNEKHLHWNQLIKIFKDRGFKPELLV